MTPRRLFFIIAAALLSAVAAPSQSGAQSADVIRGRVTGPDSAGIEGVTVTATSISGNVTRTARTDKNGRFTLTFPGGDGDYMVSYAAMGFAAKRFEVKRAADEEILVADTRLARVGAVLDPVKITAERQKVQRNDVQPDVSGTEKALNNSAVPANLMGDLAAMAASLPGVLSVPGSDGSADGYSVLGLGADQNNTTLNGMSFAGSSLPRDASVSSSLITSPYDVSRGGFSGAQMSLRTRSGSNFLTRGMSLNVDAPQLQWTDRASRSLGQEYSNYSLGGTLSGPLRLDKAFYNVAYQLGRRSNDLQSLLNTNAGGLQAASVSADSVARLLSILNTAKVPLSVGSPPSDRIGDSGSLFGSVDIAPPSSSSGQALNISFNGNWSKQSPSSIFATELPAHSGDRTNWRGGLQARSNTYFGVGILSETSLGVSASKSWGTPYLQIPGGQVRVNSDFADGTSGVQNLVFGGNQFLNSTTTTNTVGLLNQLSWFSASNRHRLKMTTEARRDGSVLEQANNSLGTFSFNSLADLQASKPSLFSRQLGFRERDVSQYVGGLSLGDSWRKTDNLQIQYGVRADANRFARRPALNSTLETAFGVKNDAVPDEIYFSPRAGFSWTYGQAPQIAGFDGAFRGPRAVVRGGLGVFQNTPSTNLVGNALDNTGLASGVQQLTCIGAATPIPDWAAYAGNTSSIPTKCADGTNGTVFSSAAPAVSLFAKDYKAPRSIRSNLSWNGPVLGNRFTSQIEATYSLNLNQQGITDLNFNPASRFMLPSEGGRPVYVNPSSIVPTTGATAAQDGRLSPLFSRIVEQTSDLKSQSRQVRVSLSPATFSSSLSWGLSYVYGNNREQFNGFNSTVSNPLSTEWGRSSFDSRHQIVYNLGYNFFDFIRVSWFGQFRSGSPYTPMVAGDINGDGYNNDRAFIPQVSSDPALLSTLDPALANGIQSLLNNGSASAKNCLQSQPGKLAARNSCQGPWISTANMSVSFNPVKVRMPQRATMSFQISNPLGAADMLLHGSSSLRGWGQPTNPDPQLLYVRGFDPVAKKYKYEVNQRFGKTNQALGAFRLPVTLTAMMRFDLGPTREKQTLTQQLDRGRRTEGTKVPEQLLRAIYGTGGIPNPIATILRQQDSIHLTGMQADSLASMNRRYTIRNDQLWSPIAKDFANLPNGYDKSQVYNRYMTARKATIDELAIIGPTIKSLLTAEQRRKLPALIVSYLDPRYLASIRSGTATFSGVSGFGGSGAQFGGEGTFVSAGGGGTQTVIIRH
ncbi:MAG TPA: carboxypeptidase regulatory-like domain-containing protein [Gemmatimonadaceae bacterium]|nr:carboxypeptidase regulatory-like domain-containing protein [Gemmatimonadaceae bacterium]